MTQSSPPKEFENTNSRYTREDKLMLRARKLCVCCVSFFALSATLQSCSRDSTSSSDNDQPKAEYLYALQCDLTKVDRPEGCAPNAPYIIGRFKVGDIDVHIPRQYLQQPVQDVREADRVSYSFCWPGLEKDLSGCARYVTRIILYVTQATYVTPPSSSRAVRRRTKEELLAETTANNYTGPHRIDGTRIDEYRHRNQNGVAPIFSFQAEDDVRIAQCANSAYGRCIIRVWDIQGLNIRYEFGINLINDWPEIDAAVIDLVVSFVVESAAD